MLASLIGGLVAVLLAVAGYFRTGPKRERELAALELDLLERAGGHADIQRNLSVLIERRTRQWRNNIGLSQRILRQAIIQLVAGGLLGVGGALSYEYVPARYQPLVLPPITVGAVLAVVGIVMAALAMIQDLRGKWE